MRNRKQTKIEPLRMQECLYALCVCRARNVKHKLRALVQQMSTNIYMQWWANKYSKFQQILTQQTYPDRTCKDNIHKKEPCRIVEE